MGPLGKIVDDYVKEVEVDYVCLAQVPGAVARDLEITFHSEIRERSLIVIEGLLKHGLRPGAYLRKGFQPWTGTTEQILARIRAEWPAAPNHPTLEEPICWLAPPKRPH
jgi:hypothetical protein